MKTNSLIPIVTAAVMVFAPHVLVAAHLALPPPWLPGVGKLAGVGEVLSPTQPAHPISPGQARSILDNYMKIHDALAQDSLQGVAENAAAIAKAVRTDPGRTFARRLAKEADRLAEARDLATARHAFLRVSPHLIGYVKKNHVASFYLGYCRMEKAAWLQADPTIANPYMGKAMPRCAWFRELKAQPQPRGETREKREGLAPAAA